MLACLLIIDTQHLASTPGRSLEEGRPGIDCLRMRGIFHILSSKFDRKLNYLRRACTL